MQTVEKATPPQIADDLIVDFDAYRAIPPDADQYQEALALRAHAARIGGDILWTARNGGHWIATRGETIKNVFSDYEKFSTSSVFIGAPNPEPLVPTEYDEPEHGCFRRLLEPTFRPRSVEFWESEARSLAIELIEELRPRGRCEFIQDFASQLPIIIFLKIVNLPLTDRQMLIGLVNESLRPKSEASHREAVEQMSAYVDEVIEARWANPGEDVLSLALRADVMGRRLNIVEARGLTRSLLIGGLDTVAAVLAWAAWFLATSPKHRRRLKDDPKIIPRATNELLRRFSVVNNARVVRRDMTYLGMPMRAGDQILLPTPLFGLDPEIFDDPLTVDFDRKDAHKHLAFGAGIHRCVGAPLAVREIGLFLEEWIKRIPDFSLDPDDPPVRVTGVVQGFERLSLVWSP
ncbi:MAG: cytochrome P450 [Dehalococcoidia bacterium]